MMGALTIFGEGSFVFNVFLFWGKFGLVTKLFEDACTI